MWFEAHDSLPRHPKTLKLARLLSLNQLEAVRLLWLLFDWGLIAAKKDGSLNGMEPQDIAMALGYPEKKADKLVSALIDAGYLECNDGTYSIHDWYDYAGKLMDKRESDRKKESGNPKEFLILSDGFPVDKLWNSCGRPLVTVPNLTV